MPNRARILTRAKSVATAQSLDRWFQSAVRYLARFDRTTAQVEALLRAKGAGPRETRTIVGRLQDLGYLDDRAYAERWIEGRLARKPMGIERLRYELLGKGLPEDLTDDAIRAQLGDIDEDTLARRALAMRQRRGGRLSPLHASYLLHRWGFAEETVARIIGEYRGRGDAER
ncbi:MAG TPA: regulatory protein RecX [Nitrospira sp.]|nr:regulatory protein RecX [Nitrospira sp.]